MAYLWYASRVSEKIMKKLVAEYKIDISNIEKDDDSEDNQQYLYDVCQKIKNNIEGFTVHPFGFCCREQNGYIIGYSLGGIYSNEGHCEISVEVNPKDKTELKLFCNEKGLPSPKYYLVAADCRVCGS